MCSNAVVLLCKAASLVESACDYIVPHADTFAMDNKTLRRSGKSPADLQQPAHESLP